MDGVIYHGNQILPGVPEFIHWLHDEKKEYLFLTNSLIKMSRLESGIIRLKPEQNSLNDIVMQAVKDVYKRQGERV